ncbi:MAG: hypothetical protein QMC93_02245 [Patescibacteria group bacterium]|nr:hypothetical protein [Patescibacteria group bacterium]
MHKEVELQIIIKDQKAVEKKLRKTGKFIKTRTQIDKYFVPPYRNFFAQKPEPLEYLRIRYEKGKKSFKLFFFAFW